LFLGIFGGAIGYFLWTFALTRLSPTQVAVFVNLNPMIATLLGATLLAEKLTGIFIAGFAAVLAGVLLVNLRGRGPLDRHPITN
jgi:drug/metabolite transporter (DMT)-like permease